MDKAVSLQISGGAVVLIDESDLTRVESFHWAVERNRHCLYARRSFRNAGRTCKVRMHRFLLDVTDSRIHVDHINGDGLDNRRSNLRLCSLSENVFNRAANLNNTTGFKGVCRKGDRWTARIGKEGTYLGTFGTAEEAAAAYDQAASHRFGEYARPNLVQAALRANRTATTERPHLIQSVRTRQTA